MLYVFWKLKFLDYVFYVFLKCHFKKRKKSRFLDLKKTKKRILELCSRCATVVLYAGKLSANKRLSVNLGCFPTTTIWTFIFLWCAVSSWPRSTSGHCNARCPYGAQCWHLTNANERSADHVYKINYDVRYSAKRCHLSPVHETERLHCILWALHWQSV